MQMQLNITKPINLIAYGIILLLFIMLPTFVRMIYFGIIYTKKDQDGSYCLSDKCQQKLFVGNSVST